MKLSLRSAGLLLVAGGVSLAAGCSGCGPADSTKTTKSGASVAVTDPWPKFASAVRNNPDPKAARAAVAELTAGLTNAAPADRPQPAEPEYVAAVAAALRLTDAEKRSVGGSEFTALDANHLSECLYLSDVKAGLGVGASDPPAVRADAAFRFVVRQVVLAPSVGRIALLPPMPPTFVLSRGSGTGLERAATFIALCRQLDLDAYLIGPPQAADQPWTFQGTAGRGQPPKGPFWAVGVRASEGVLLFDPWRGEAVPGKAAGRPVTLAELKADPSACPWSADKTKPWDVTADAVKASGLYLSPPLSALAPRMTRLQEKLKDGVGVQLAVDWSAAVNGAEVAADGAKVWGWNPPADKFTPVRALGSFLPLEQGGFDPTSPLKAESVFTMYDDARLPIDRLTRLPPGVGNDSAKAALSFWAKNAYREAFLVPPNPRERLQRGQYNAAVADLVKRRDEYGKVLEGATADEPLKEWYSGLASAYNRVTQAQTPADEATARGGVDKFLRANGPLTNRAVGGMIAEAAVGEAGYLLALAAHEQAEAEEAAAARAEREGGGADARKGAKEQWVKAASGWRRYAPYADGQDASFPGRKATFDALSARAEQLTR